MADIIWMLPTENESGLKKQLVTASSWIESLNHAVIERTNESEESVLRHFRTRGDLIRCVLATPKSNALVRTITNHTSRTDDKRMKELRILLQMKNVFFRHVRLLWDKLMFVFRPISRLPPSLPLPRIIYSKKAI